MIGVHKEIAFGALDGKEAQPLQSFQKGDRPDAAFVPA